MKTEIEVEGVYLNERCEKFDLPGSAPILLKVREILSRELIFIPVFPR